MWGSPGIAVQKVVLGAMSSSCKASRVFGELAERGQAPAAIAVQHSHGRESRCSFASIECEW